MIEQVLNEIEQAERQAEEIIAAAHLSAREITLGTEEELEKLKAEYAAEFKAFTAELTENAAAEGEKQAAEKLRQAAATGAAIVKQAEKNMQRSVEYIADKISKTR